VSPTDPDVLLVRATTHGRVLVRRAAAPRGILVGCHGYLENAATQMARLESIPGAAAWTLVSAQALNRVYRGRSKQVVASWMTSEDRDTAIADNVAYVHDAVRAVSRNHPTGAIVYAGFSQGGAMAFRAGVRDPSAAGIVSAGADVPPDLLADPALRFPPVLLARGQRDEWYTAGKQDADAAALRSRGVAVEVLVYAAGHEWTGDLSAAVAAWIERLPHPAREQDL
jgi:predicted esterase